MVYRDSREDRKIIRVSEFAKNGVLMPVQKFENESSVSESASLGSSPAFPVNAHTDTSNGSLSANTKAASRLGIRRLRSKASMKDMTNDPFRFSPPGVEFRAKLIGIRDVAEARGDLMCQQALQSAKASVKASGQHKQKIFVNVSTEGLLIRDQATCDELYKFPVAKVSFIARDSADNRAFGFIYALPDGTHKFYGIKTEKTASHLVMSIRDMFHVVYEMKKRQVEDAKAEKTQQSSENGHTSGASTKDDENGDEVAVENLLDLETEVKEIEQGMQDIDKAWEAFEEDRSQSAPSTQAFNRQTSDTPSWQDTSLPSNAGSEKFQPNDTASSNGFYGGGPTSDSGVSELFMTSQESQLSDIFHQSSDSHAYSRRSQPSMSSLSSEAIVISPPPPPSNAGNTGKRSKDLSAAHHQNRFTDNFHSDSFDSLAMAKSGSNNNQHGLSGSQCQSQECNEKMGAFGDDFCGHFDEDFNSKLSMNGGKDGVGVERTDSGGNVEDVFSKLVGDIDELGKLSEQATPPKADPFYDVKNPPKRTINDLLLANGVERSGATPISRVDSSSAAMDQLNILLASTPPSQLMQNNPLLSNLGLPEPLATSNGPMMAPPSSAFTVSGTGAVGGVNPFLDGGFGTHGSAHNGSNGFMQAPPPHAQLLGHSGGLPPSTVYSTGGSMTVGQFNNLPMSTTSPLTVGGGVPSQPGAPSQGSNGVSNPILRTNSPSPALAPPPPIPPRVAPLGLSGLPPPPGKAFAKTAVVSGTPSDPFNDDFFK